MRAQYLGKLDAFLRYLDLGCSAPARVYVHGLGLSSSTLVPVAAHPALAGRRTLVIDLLGFGLSDKPDGFGYGVEEHADCVIELLDALGLESCELVGHSSGGSIAIVVASRRPDLVSALVVAEANLDPGAGPFSGAILARSENA